MNASSAGLARLGKAKALVLVALVAAFGMLALAGTSKAAPVDHNLTVDHGKLTLGSVFPDNTIIPAPVATLECPTLGQGGTDVTKCGPSPISPLVPNYPDGNGKIKVSVDGTVATVAAPDFKTPTTYVPNPTASPGDSDYWVPIQTTVPNGLTGTWDAGTGELSLTGDLRISVLTGADNPPTVESCQIDAPDITWSTGLNPVTPGIPFNSAQGLDGNGAISASWADLPNGTEVNGGNCETVNAVIHDTGAIWFGVGESTPPPAPVCEPPLEGLWPDCVAPPTPKPEKKAKITKVKLLPGKKTIRAGKRQRMRVRVVNKGDKAATVTVRLNLRKKRGVKLANRVKLRVPAGKAAVRRVVFRTNRRARGKYRVVAVGRGAAQGKRSSSVITVKPVRKKRRR